MDLLTHSPTVANSLSIFDFTRTNQRDECYLKSGGRACVRELTPPIHYAVQQDRCLLPSIVSINCVMIEVSFPYEF